METPTKHTDFSKMSNDEILQKKMNLKYTYEQLKEILKTLDENMTFIEEEYRLAEMESDKRL